MSRVIDQENDPEVLKAYLRYSFEVVEKLTLENKRLRKEKDKLAQAQFMSDEKLLVLRKRMFGKSSEKSPGSRMREKEDPELLLHSKRLCPPPKDEELEKLVEIKCDHELSLDELAQIALQYGYPKDSEWELIEGLYDESFEVDVVPRKYKKLRHRRFKYRLRATKGSDKEIIVTAPGPVKLMPGSSYSIDFGVEVAIDKTLYHIPLERQRRQMEEKGLSVAVKTLYSQSFFVSCYLEKIALKIKEEILTLGTAVHLDETPWPIGHKDQDDGYLWVMSNQAGSYYQFEPTRSGKIAKELLQYCGGLYQGPLLTDGYSGYNQFKKQEGVELAYCWAHVRRKFKDIQKNYPKECGEILGLIGRLSKIERKSKTFEELKRNRLEKSKPLIDKIQKWLIKTKTEARGESYLEKSINYAMNQWEGLTKFLQDERIPLTNNEAERAVRQAVMGRKNFYGSQTINGADVISTLYTVIESCKKLELDPKDYIRMAVKMAIAKETPPTPLQYAKQTRAH